MKLDHLMYALAIFLIGVLSGIAVMPDHKSNCDQFGATSFNKTVYDCHPKQPPTK